MDMQPTQFQLGTRLISASETQFSVWAPKAKKVEVQLFAPPTADHSFELIRSVDLQPTEQGCYSGTVPDCGAGSLYRFSVDGNPGRPDPRSRFQPFGVHGPSQVMDPNSFSWSDDQWSGVAKRDLVIYETHIGAMTEQGDYTSASNQLDQLIKMGITAIELLPINQTPGKWNWGYDGVNFFAPRYSLGTPDDLKQFIDICHQKGLAVLLDVVYNHVGPEGNYLNTIGPYGSSKFGTPWGDSLDFDQPQVRQFVIENTLYWIDEFHFDGLRFDAVHYMFDDSEVHILDEIRERFHGHAERTSRTLHLIGESNIYDPHLVGNTGKDAENWDAIWSDCLMHSIYSVGAPSVRLTDRKYTGPSDVAAALEHAYVFSTPGGVRIGADDREKNHNGDRNYISSLIMATQTHDSASAIIRMENDCIN